MSARPHAQTRTRTRPVVQRPVRRSSRAWRLSSAPRAARHLRAGDIGPVTVLLSHAGDARRSGTVVLSRSQRVAFEAGELYFDVHTRDHLTGLVRAQIGAPRRHDAP